MKKTMLLPHSFQKIGWCILTPIIPLGVINLIYPELPAYIFTSLGLSITHQVSTFTTNAEHWINNTLVIGLVIGAIFATCSRERIEDELTSQLRLKSLMIALYISYALVILGTILIYDLSYLYFMTYNTMTLLLIFLATFHVKLWRLRKETGDEE